MKKVLFIFICLFFSINACMAAINDVNYVGGTGGSKITNLEHEENDIDSSGIIYDKDASLVYEISYTNDTNYIKKLVIW